MATDDDDFLSGPIAAPDAEPTPAERAHAKAFADVVDKTLAGRTPPAMSADARALLEVATVIRATRGNAELAPERRAALVEGALRQAVRAPAAAVVPIARARAKRFAPWVIAGGSALVAAAAVVALLVRPAVTSHAPTAQQVPASWKSRSADALIGPIAREHAGDASARIDAIFADRLDGYRERRLARGGQP